MPHSQLLVNYVPGDECRIAIVEDGKLEEFHAERMNAVSRVGNIYAGVVTNVEASIQAAFVDFGVEHHGFLHVTDLHPRYFPGEDDDTTESVGKKTPRRDRPPIQACLRRGDEVIVQVLKEGVGTKGPTLTSYLSIPGRYLVMMPQMDRVGVSRKVEDEDLRRRMREILDQLDLPEGNGFILRTAGLERTKLELKRDLAYLLRLHKDMEARRASGRKPRLLYSESDLLLRSLRDLVTAETNEIVVDHEMALRRASRFLKIVAPRSQTKLLHYTGATPVFHAFGIEQQIAQMYAREVPLPSGGRLVIDETEALVAIDVNSGKARDARDAETNAYRTNVEAVDEICRQLRLRDLGGIVINDLIDMRHASNRKDIEQRFKERLKRDRARTTTLAISNFGILEMTRQRMRGSHESMHFTDCPVCRGRGLVQRPDSIAADALRSLAAVLDHANVARVEMVVAPRVASDLLSNRRRLLNALERRTGKHVDVRVSETVPIDRVAFFAYDPSGADIDVEKLPPSKSPRVEQLQEWTVEPDDESWAVDAAEEARQAELSSQQADAAAETVEEPAEPHPIEADGPAPREDGEGGRRRRRRRGGRGRGRGRDRDQAAPQPEPRADAPTSREPSMDADDQLQEPRDPELQPGAPEAGGEGGEGGGRRRRRRRRRGRGRGGDGAGAASGEPGQPMPVGANPDAPPQQHGPRETSHEPDSESSGEPMSGDEASNTDGGPRRRRRRRRGRRGGGGASGGGDSQAPVEAHAPRSTPPSGNPNPPASNAPPGGGGPRFLYSSRRKLSPSERARMPKE